MRARPITAAVAFTLVSLSGCGDADGPTAARSAPSAAPSLEVARAGGQKQVQMFDLCEPNSFNAAIGPGTCVRKDGGVTFQQFLDQIGRLGRAPAWRFDPVKAEIVLGTTLLAVNRGGEVHTFTEVEEFGGGIVPVLNHLSGNPTPAPECLALAPTDFVSPGGSFPDTPSAVGTEKYQCCIHPWMRTTVTIRSGM